MEQIDLTQRAVEQIIGREGETATFLSRCFFTLHLRIGSFASVHLIRLTQVNKRIKNARF
jgi:hypothetical protein